MEKRSLSAVKRTSFGKPATKAVRNAGKVPGVFYAKSNEPISFEVFESEINKFVFTSQSYIVDLKFEDNSNYDCVIKSVQFDPVTDRVIHVDMQGINVNDKVTLEVPIVIAGQSEGVRQGGQLNQQMHRLSISTLPQYIPQAITVDVTALRLGHTMTVKDLVLENIEINNAPDSVLVSVTVPRGVSLESLSLTDAPTEPEVIARGKKETEE